MHVFIQFSLAAVLIQKGLWVDMTFEQFQYIDELKVQLPIQKFVKGVNTSLMEYMQIDENYDRFVENVRLLMHLKNMSVETFSKAGGFHRAYVGRLLRKESTCRNVSLESIWKLAKMLSIKPSLLLTADIRKQFQKALNEVST